MEDPVTPDEPERFPVVCERCDPTTLVGSASSAAGVATVRERHGNFHHDHGECAK